MLIQLSLEDALYPGSIRGTTIQNSKGGMQLHSKAKPKNPQTAKQQANRQLFRVATAAYRSLPMEAVEAWEAAEYSGLSGFELYMSTNQLLQVAGLPYTEVPPEYEPPLQVDIISVYVNGLNTMLDAQVTESDQAPGTKLFLLQSAWLPYAQPVSAARLIRYPLTAYTWSSLGLIVDYEANGVPAAQVYGDVAYVALLIVVEASGLQAQSATFRLDYSPIT